MGYMSRALINKRLIILERNIRKAEKILGIKAYPWTTKRNVKNQGNDNDNNYTDLQLAFCEEYPKDMNATQAAIRAGYGKGGAATQGCLLLKMPKIQRKINESNTRRMKRLNITADNVVREIALIAFSNITQVAKWTNSHVTLKESARLTRNETAAIKSITETVGKYGSSLKVDLYDKPGALVLLCRYLNILDGNANVIDPDETAKKFKDAYTSMFESVPLSEPVEPDSLADVKKPVKIKAGKGKSVKSTPSKQNPDTELYQKSLVFPEKANKETKSNDYLMEE